MTFHVMFNPDPDGNVDIKRTNIQPIMFLSKQLFGSKTRYWLTELEVTGMVWIAKKLRHFIEFCKKSFTVIFTDHFATVDLISQTSLITVNTDKLNLRLIRAFQFLFVLFIRIRIKSEQLHIISNALSRLLVRPEAAKNSQRVREISILKDLNDLDDMFATTVFNRKASTWNVSLHQINQTLDAHLDEDLVLVKMNQEFFTALKKAYESNNQWQKIRARLQTRIDPIDISDGIEFMLKGNQIYYVSRGITAQLCISWSLKKRIYTFAHDNNHHCEFHRAYVRIFDSLYIKHLAKRLHRYIKYCKKCQKGQIVRHASYEELNSIRTLALSFHTVTLDFIISLPTTSDDLNAVLITTDKFSKRINLLPNKIIWSALEWASPWLAMLQRENWGLPRAIISDKNRKFVTTFWKVMFHHLNVALLFTTTYHPQVDDQSEKINQTIKITLKYAMMKRNTIDFFKLLSSIQAMKNNSANATTSVSSNESLYDFKILKTTDLLNNDLAKARAMNDNPATSIKKERNILKKETKDAINYDQVMIKIRYDSRHKLIDLKINQKIFIRLHKGYNQSGLSNRKFSKQRIGPIAIIDKMGRLAYKLDIPFTWKIHSVISITYLKSALLEKNPYQREPTESSPIEIEKKEDNNVYEIEKIVVKRRIYIERGRRRRAHSEFRVKWLEWSDPHNE